MIRILISDDQDLVRTGFRLILSGEPDFEVVADAPDGSAATRLAGELRPDVVLMDIRMPVQDGLSATRDILSTNPAIRVLILTTFDLDEYVYDALAAGASGFLLKDVKASNLAEAIRTVHAGEALLAPSVTKRLIERFVAQRPTIVVNPGSVGQLTDRETEVLTLIARGRSNPEIAAELVLSQATVKTHITRIFLKLGVRDRAQAVIAAYDADLVRPGTDASPARSGDA